MRGTYALLIQVPEKIEVKIGELGKISFEKGAYAYIGSGLKNLESRIERHLAEEKNLYWHIDYLLTRSRVKEVLYGESEERKECDIASKMADEFSSIEGFGSSDCDCESHLFYSESVSKLEKGVKSNFKEVGLKPETW